MDLIDDIRTMDQFKTITFSKYKRPDVKKEWMNSMIKASIEPCCYWTTELICSALFTDLWELILFFYAKYIHVGNPKLPIYLDMRFQLFKKTVMTMDELQLRNNLEIRKLFIEMVCVLCTSTRSHSYEAVQISKEIGIPKSKLVAPTIEFNKAFKPADPRELIVAMNEFGYMLHSKNVMGACYWIEWIIQFTNAHKCVAVERPYSVKHKTDGIWVVWDTILCYTEHALCKQIIEALLRLFSIAFVPASKDRRKFLIYEAITLCCDQVKLDIQMVSNPKIIEQAYEKCWLMFKDIKKHEMK